MHKITVKSKSPIIDANFGGLTNNVEKWLEENQKHLGKPIRWVRAKVAVPPDHDGGTGYFVYPDEQYDDDDIIDEKQQEENGEFVYYVQLKAEYTIEIEDYNPVPQSISPAQARLALIQSGLYGAVESAVNLSTDDVKVYWDHATVFERDNAILKSMASAIGITDEQLDNLFRLGATL